MALLDYLVERVNTKGWLSLATIYFDNGFNIDVFASSGYIAYSASKGCFFTVEALDSTDSSIIENRFVKMDGKYTGMQQNITVVGEEHLQHFDMALYAHSRFFSNAEDKLPVPDIPDKDTVMGYQVNPDTGLIDGLDEYCTMGNNIYSLHPIYSKEDTRFYSGAHILNWQKFYTRQQMFLDLLSSTFNVTDAI